MIATFDPKPDWLICGTAIRATMWVIRNYTKLSKMSSSTPFLALLRLEHIALQFRTHYTSWQKLFYSGIVLNNLVVFTYSKLLTSPCAFFWVDVVSADSNMWKVDHDKFIGEVSCALTSFGIYPLDINCNRNFPIPRAINSRWCTMLMDDCTVHADIQKLSQYT